MVRVRGFRWRVEAGDFYTKNFDPSPYRTLLFPRPWMGKMMRSERVGVSDAGFSSLWPIGSLPR